MSWKLTNLGTLIDVLSGFAFDSKKFSDSDGKPLIRIRDIKRSYTETYYNGNFEEKYVVKSGDVLIGMDGEFNVAEWNGTDALLNQRVCKVTVKDPNHLDLRYLLYFLPYELKLIEDKASFVTVKHLSVNDVKNIQIPLPPLTTQKRIAEILDAADALRHKDQELLKKYDELAQAIFIDMFGNPLKNAKCWDVKMLGKECDVRDGTHDSPKYVLDGYPLVTSKNLKHGSIDLVDVNYVSKADFVSINLRSKVDLWDILMPMIGTIGNPVIVDFEPQFAIKNVCLIKKSERFNPYFLSFLLSSDLMENVIRKISRGGTQKFLSLGDIRNIEVPIPPILLQNEFQNVISHHLRLKGNIIKCMNCNLFDSLINKAFKGELVS